MHALAAARDLVRYRSLLLALAVVQFRTRYSNAILGAGWALATPMALFLVFAYVFRPIFSSAFEVEHYEVWLLAALFPWTFLSASVGETIRTLGANATFIKAHKFPREALPLAGVMSQLANLAIALVVVTIASLQQFGPRVELLGLPVAAGLLFVFTAGLCLLLAALDFVYKDVRYLVDLALLGGFFLTPIFYPLELIEGRVAASAIHQGLGALVVYNPATSMVASFRACLVPGHAWPALLYPALAAIALFAFGLGQFRRLVDKYVDLA